MSAYPHEIVSAKACEGKSLNNRVYNRPCSKPQRREEPQRPPVIDQKATDGDGCNAWNSPRSVAVWASCRHMPGGLHQPTRGHINDPDFYW